MGPGSRSAVCTNSLSYGEMALELTGLGLEDKCVFGEEIRFSLVLRIEIRQKFKSLYNTKLGVEVMLCLLLCLKWMLIPNIALSVVKKSVISDY